MAELKKKNKIITHTKKSNIVDRVSVHVYVCSCMYIGSIDRYVDSVWMNDRLIGG